MSSTERTDALNGGCVEIRSRRLLLRALRASDAGPMTLYCADPRVARMTSSIPHPYPPGAAQAFIEATLSGRRDELVWAIDATPEGGAELLGTVVLRPSGGEIGYWVGPPFWNTGYASEAVNALVSHAFSARAAERLWAQAQVENEASAHVLANAGFVEFGRSTSFSVARGASVETRTFELTRERWQAHVISAGGEA